MRFLYTLLGLMLGLTIASFNLTHTFNKVFVPSAVIMYRYGCGQGLFISDHNINYANVVKCAEITQGLQDLLEEIIDK